MVRVACVDKDGTIVAAKQGTFINKPDDQVLLEGAVDSLIKLFEADYKICIVSNQGGVAAGHKKIETVFEEMLYCHRLIHEAIGWGEDHPSLIETYYFCPDYSGQECWYVSPCDASGWRYPRSFADCGKGQMTRDLGLKGEFRKPNPGMLKIAAHFQVRCTLEQTLEAAIMIGDREEDELAAQAANIPFLQADTWRSQEWRESFSS